MISYAVIADGMSPNDVINWFKLYEDEIQGVNCTEDNCTNLGVLVYLNADLMYLNVCAVACEEHAIATFGEKARIALRARARELN